MFRFCPEDSGRLKSVTASEDMVGTEAMTWKVTDWKFCSECYGMYAVFEKGHGATIDSGSPALVLVNNLKRSWNVLQELIGRN